MKTTVTVSRKWHNPQIIAQVSVDGIALTTELSDFCEAVAREIGSVTWVFTDAGFRAKFDAAIERVVQGIKDESSKVV